MRFTRILIIMVVAMALAACGTSKSNNSNSNINSANDPVPTAPALLASGGTSTSGTGGNGGYIHIESYGGAVRVLKSGTVDAIVTVPTFTPDFGTDPTAHAVVSAGTTTTVVVDTDDFSGQLCMATSLGSPYLYTGDGNGTCGDTNDILVTGLTVESGAILVLADYGYWGGYGELWLDNDLVVNGTIRTDAPNGLYIEAKTIDVESSGKIVTSATTTDANAGELYLGYGNGMTKQIINHGMIEAKGLGNGSGGYMYFEPDDLVVNTGTIDASGGDSTVADSSGGAGGSSGALDVFVDYGDFYSSGTVRVNGGKGAGSGGNNEADVCNTSYYCDSVYVETARYGNTLRNGDIIISGVWEANGGDGADGNGGYGGYIYLQTDALGKVTINANMSVKGGDGTGAGSYYGASTYGIVICQPFDPNGSGLTLPPVAGKISFAGTYDLRGGSGDAGGGSGGYLEIYGNNNNQDATGADVELVGFPTLILNGGDGANGGSATGQAFEIFTYNTGSYPAGPITNEANIEARGGKAAATSGSYGGSGGTVEMITNGISDPSETITNSGSIDISGGTGDTGGSNYMIWLWAQHVTNAGNLMANGGNGTTTGGNGGNIYLMSNDGTTPATLTGIQSVIGGMPGGSDGAVNIDAGGPT
jgi:hypothetical protein